jgi:hypothetical protein
MNFVVVLVLQLVGFFRTFLVALDFAALFDYRFPPNKSRGHLVTFHRLAFLTLFTF